MRRNQVKHNKMKCAHNSILTLSTQRQCQTSRNKGSVHKIGPSIFQMPVTSSVYLGYILEVPMTTSIWIWLFAIVAHRTQKNTFIHLLKDMIKGTDEESHRVRSGGILSSGASVLWSWGVSPSWWGYIHPPGSSLDPVLLDFLEASSLIMIGINSISSPFPLPGGWGWAFQASTCDLVFPVINPHPGTHPESLH